MCLRCCMSLHTGISQHSMLLLWVCCFPSAFDSLHVCVSSAKDVECLWIKWWGLLYSEYHSFFSSLFLFCNTWKYCSLVFTEELHTVGRRFQEQHDNTEQRKAGYLTHYTGICCVWRCWRTHITAPKVQLQGHYLLDVITTYLSPCVCCVPIIVKVPL